jgi:hypothetical protein
MSSLFQAQAMQILSTMTMPIGQVNKTDVKLRQNNWLRTENQCCGSGSASFGGIRIRNFGSGS